MIFGTSKREEEISRLKKKAGEELCEILPLLDSITEEELEEVEDRINAFLKQAERNFNGCKKK